MKGLYFAWVQHSNFHVHQSTRLCTLQRSYWETIWHKYFTPYKYKKFLLDEIRCAGRCDPVRYISLAADVCKINSIVFPNLGSMAHSKMSGCLCGMQKQNCEKKQASRGIPVSYEIKPEVNFGSPTVPLLVIWKQAVIDATASHIFISANALPGHILAHIFQDLGCIRD